MTKLLKTDPKSNDFNNHAAKLRREEPSRFRFENLARLGKLKQAADQADGKTVKARAPKVIKKSLLKLRDTKPRYFKSCNFLTFGKLDDLANEYQIRTTGASADTVDGSAVSGAKPVKATAARPKSTQATQQLRRKHPDDIIVTDDIEFRGSIINPELGSLPDFLIGSFRESVERALPFELTDSDLSQISRDNGVSRKGE